ncbi:hypothetical protein BP6252_05497 [Coleophoma cylindrospora]|uniref:Uncharacterized protein n=1 Tax=Coleophoma cylindrospora TaxID=1849047 RepID=A0A3D8RUB0_9HELO|nr:hypothetical protein BP6252_05497 [Coleophoma cylindrospora]
MAPSKKHSGSKQSLNKSKPQVEAIAPDWPAFKPLVATADLSLETLSESQIVVIRNFWTSSLCKNYVTFLKTLPLVTTPGKPKKGEALRVNDRFQIDDPLFANRLWIETGLRELVCGGGEAGVIEDGDFMSPEERIRLCSLISIVGSFQSLALCILLITFRRRIQRAWASYQANGHAS